MLSAQPGFHLIKLDVALLFFTFIASFQTIIAQDLKVNVEVEPREITLPEGANLTAWCSMDQPLYSCAWEQLPVLYVNEEKDIPGIQYHGKRKKNGTCGITIKNIERKFDGNLKCYLELKIGSVMRNIYGTVEIFIARPPQAPRININGMDPVNPKRATFQENQTIEVECTIKFGDPAAIISWYIGDELIEDKLSQPETSSLGQKYKWQWKTYQTLKRKLTFLDNGKNLKCVGRHIALGNGTVHHSPVILNVLFPPKPESEVIVQCIYVIGLPQVIVVTFKANPRPTIQWLIDKETVPDGAKDTSGRFMAFNLSDADQSTWKAVLYIDKVRPENVRKNYVLIANNSLGEVKYKVVISVCSALTVSLPHSVDLTSSSATADTDITVCTFTGIVVAIVIVMVVIVQSVLMSFVSTRRWRSFVNVPDFTYWSNEDVVDNETEKIT